MPEPMVRKEFELTRDEADKLARVAAERGCSEDEVVRAAVEELRDVPPEDRLSTDIDDWPDLPAALRQMAANGLIRLPRKRTSAEQRSQQERLALLRSYSTPLNLSALLDEDREPSF